AAYRAYQTAEQSEEQARAAALRDALARYTELQTSAGQLYETIYGAFQQIEKMRQRVAGEAEQAQRAVARAEQLLQTYGSNIRPRSEGVTLLEQARALL